MHLPHTTLKTEHAFAVKLRPQKTHSQIIYKTHCLPASVNAKKTINILCDSYGPKTQRAYHITIGLP